MATKDTALSLPQMSLPFGVEIHPAALVVPQTLDDEQIIALGTSLRSIHTASAWWVADYILFVSDMHRNAKGGRRVGKAIYDKVAKLWPAYSRGHLQNLASVARRVPPKLRSAALAFDHHIHIATLADEKEAEKLQAHYVRVAVEAEMTADELRMAIADTRRGVAHQILPPKERKALAAGRAEPADVPRGTIEHEAEDDGLPIARPDAQEPLGETHAHLAEEAHRAVSKLRDWYVQQRKRGKPEYWTPQRKKMMEHELHPLIEAMSATADIYNELTNASESGQYAGS